MRTFCLGWHWYYRRLREGVALGSTLGVALSMALGKESSQEDLDRSAEKQVGVTGDCEDMGCFAGFHNENHL